MKLFFITLLSIWLFASSVHAAMLSVKVQPANEGTVAVDVMVDTQGESINSADVSLTFPSDLLTFSGYVETEGVIPLWVERPHLTDSKTVRFSGVIPGGLDREYDPNNPQKITSTLAELLFTVRKAGSGNIAITQAQLLKNDGLGTTVATTTNAAPIQTMNTTESTPADTTPPEPFTIEILEKSSFGKTPRLATFAAIDTGSGIDHYEARIRRGGWHRVTSPYPLPFRFFSYTLAVRAYDFAGNYREQRISVPGENPRVLLLSLCGLSIIGFLIYKNRNRL